MKVLCVGGVRDGERMSVDAGRVILGAPLRVVDPDSERPLSSYSHALDRLTDTIVTKIYRFEMVCGQGGYTVWILVPEEDRGPNAMLARLIAGYKAAGGDSKR